LAILDVYNIKLFSVLQNVEMLNVFNYIVSGGTVDSADAQEVSDKFNSDVLTKIAAICAIEVDFERIETFQWGNPSDTALIPKGSLSEQDGLRTGEAMASFSAWSYTLNRSVPGQRSGGKRFAGISETDLDGYTPETAVLTPIAQLSTALASVLVGSNAEYSQFVARRPLVLGVTPTGYVPATISFGGVGTQNTRKKPLDDQ
jgi:hypothetical protein